MWLTSGLVDGKLSPCLPAAVAAVVLSLFAMCMPLLDGRPGPVPAAASTAAVELPLPFASCCGCSEPAAVPAVSSPKDSFRSSLCCCPLSDCCNRSCAIPCCCTAGADCCNSSCAIPCCCCLGCCRCGSCPAAGVVAAESVSVRLIFSRRLTLSRPLMTASVERLRDLNSRSPYM